MFGRKFRYVTLGLLLVASTNGCDGCRECVPGDVKGCVCSGGGYGVLECNANSHWSHFCMSCNGVSDPCLNVQCNYGYHCVNGSCEEKQSTCLTEHANCYPPYESCCQGLYCIDNRCLGCSNKIGEECWSDESCCQGSDLKKGVWCNTANVCATCSKETGECMTELDCCPAADATSKSLMCASDGTCKPICSTDADCTAPAICMPYGECAPPSCSADSDCGGSKPKCCSGACMEDCGYGPATGCSITSKGGVIFNGQTIQLHAVAYRGDPDSGAVMVPGAMFTWKSSASGSVSVNTLTGEISGKTTPGEAWITAKYGWFDCGTVRYANVEPPSTGADVAVYDSETGLPVEGAVVVSGTEQLTTNAAGIASGFDSGGDVHVFHRDYRWVSVIGVVDSMYVIHLLPNVDGDRAGGYRGKFDFSEIKYDAVRLGITGNSFGGNLMDLDLGSILGEMIQTKIDMTQPVPFHDWISFPGAVWGGANYFGIPDLIPMNYRVVGKPGMRTAWGIGGGLSSKKVKDLIPIVTSIIGECQDLRACAFGKVFTQILPLINGMSHAVVSAFKVNPIEKIDTPCIQDGTKYPCIETDNKPLVDSSKMADYAGFPSLALKLTSKMTMRSKFTLAELPKLRGKCMTGLAGLAAVDVPNMGLVPLGITAGIVDPDNTGKTTNCKIHYSTGINPDNLGESQVMMRYAPLHGGIEGNKFVFVFAALALDSLLEGSAAWSLRISQRLPMTEATYDYTGKPFMDIPEGAAYESTSRKIAGPTSAVSQAAMYRYKVGNPSGEWHVYSVKTSDVSLPAVPAGFTDRAVGADMTLQAISLGSGTLDELVTSKGNRHLNDLVTVVDAFSTVSCLSKSPEADEPICQIR